jgi:CO/xanthine dehydrogenase Mo-binding subunit
VSRRDTAAPLPRLDAADKASGKARYVADLSLPGMLYAAVARSTEPHARITRIGTQAARAADGVFGVFTAADVSQNLYGRSLADCPLLAREKVRFTGERVAAVVAATRAQAEAAAALVEIDYEPLDAVTTPEEALAAGAPAVHEEPWAYAGARARQGDTANVIYHHVHGPLDEVQAAVAAAAWSVDRVYQTKSVHQGYLEPQACVADYRGADSVRIWLTNKAPYRIREMIARCLGIAASAITLEPVTLGGDFGGKGSAQDAPLCAELSRLTGRPVKLVLRYSEDLTSTNPRHPAEIRVQLGCDHAGRIVAASVRAVLNAGAYGGFTPSGTGPQHATEVPSYRIPAFASEFTRVYTNTVPRGNMRAPGAPQGIFAFESAIDELAARAGLDPVLLRRRNLLTTGDRDTAGQTWLEHRGTETLDAALAALSAAAPPPVPSGWRYGRGLSLYSRGTANRVSTSVRLTPAGDGGVRVETPIIETGTGSHTALRQMIASQLALPLEQVSVAGVATDRLPRDAGAGGSRVTAGLAAVVDAAAKAWGNRVRDEPVVVELDQAIGPDVGSYVVQVAQVAVDPATGELRVLEILTAADVAAVVNPAAFQMQIDGGVAMGFGFACLEDLEEADGQVWSGNLGDYKLPTARDVPRYRTVLVPGGTGVGTANVKSIGESTTPPVAPAIAGAVFAATGCRVRELPITAEKIYSAMQRAGGTADDEVPGAGNGQAGSGDSGK